MDVGKVFRDERFSLPVALLILVGATALRESVIVRE